MNAKVAYTIEFPEKIELFAESKTGTFDFVEDMDRTQTGTPFPHNRIIDLIGEDVPAEELFFPDHGCFKIVYSTRIRQCRIFRYAPRGCAPLPASIAGFLLRYPAFARALRSGDFVEAGKIVELSRKLKAFRPLLRYIAGERAFFVFALYWLNEFADSKDADLEELLSGKAPPHTRFYEVFDFARPTIRAHSVESFYLELRKKLRELLVDRREPVVLPIVGTRFSPLIGKLSSLLENTEAEGLKRSLVEGLSAESVSARSNAYIENLHIHIIREPYNAYDPNALAVLVGFPDGRINRAGYLKRETAAILAPFVDEGIRFRVSFSKIYCNEADVELRIEG